MIRCHSLLGATLAGLLVGPLLSCSAAISSIAHRGNSLFAPENTVAAFQAALGKADLVELDGRVSSDGRLVVMHDDKVDRTTDGTGAVSGMTLAQLKALDAGSWFAPKFAGERVPTLEEALTAILPQAIPLIERKAGSAAVYVTELRRLGVVRDVVVQSFDWAFLASVHALEPDIRLGALGSGAFTAANLAAIRDSGASLVAWEKASVTPAMVESVHNAGMTLFVWTVDGAEIQRHLALGVDGIISNDPGLVRDLQQTPDTGPVNLAEGLLAYWPLDDGLADATQTQVADRRGANPATLNRAAGFTAWQGAGVARLGGCLQIDGTRSWVGVPSTAALDIGTNGLTVSAWVMTGTLPSQLGTSYGAIFDSTTDCYVLYLDRSNKELRFKVTDTAGHAARPGIPEGQLQLNQWLHVVGTFDGQVGPASGQTTVYLNGQPADVHTGNDGSSPVGLTGSVKTGQLAAMGREGPTGGNSFAGYLDDIAIWNRPLRPAEVARLFEGGQRGQALEDLLRQPTADIQFAASRLTPNRQHLELDFRNLGSWTGFRLLFAPDLDQPFRAVPGLAPVHLGQETYRFICPLSGAASGWLRVEGTHWGGLTPGR